MLDTGKLEEKLRELGVELGEMEVKGGMRRCFERMKMYGGLRSERAGQVELDREGVWMGKENENEEENKLQAHEWSATSKAH